MFLEIIFITMGRDKFFEKLGVVGEFVEYLLGDFLHSSSTSGSLFNLGCVCHQNGSQVFCRIQVG